MRKEILLLLLTFPLAFSACSQNIISKNNLVDKKWSLRSSKITSVKANNKEAIKKIEELSNYDVTEDCYKDYLIFGDDDSIKSFCYIEVSAVNGYVEEEVKKEGTYSLDGNILTIPRSNGSVEVAQAKISKNELHTVTEYSVEELKELAGFLDRMYGFPGLEVSKLTIKRIHVLID